MCGSMVDIQSTAAEIRRGKKRRKKSQGKNIMVCPIHRATIIKFCSPLWKPSYINKNANIASLFAQQLTVATNSANLWRHWIQCSTKPRTKYRPTESMHFTARRNARIASAVLAISILSVCLSHAGIVSKRRHVARRSLYC